MRAALENNIRTVDDLRRCECRRNGLADMGGDNAEIGRVLNVDQIKGAYKPCPRPK